MKRMQLTAGAGWTVLLWMGAWVGVALVCPITDALAQTPGKLPRPGATVGIPYDFKPDVPTTQPQELDPPANQEIFVQERERFLVPRRSSPFVAVGSWDQRDSVLALWDIRRWRKGTVINGLLPLKRPILTEDGQWLVDVTSDHGTVTIRAFPFKPNPAPVRYNPPMPVAGVMLLGVRSSELLVIVQPTEAGSALTGNTGARRKPVPGANTSFNDLAPWLLAFDLSTGKLLRQAELPDPIAYGGPGTLSASGRFAAIASHHQVLFINVETIKLVASIDLMAPRADNHSGSFGNEERVRDLCFSPDGTMLAALIGAGDPRYSGKANQLTICATRDGSILAENRPQYRSRQYDWETGERNINDRIEWSLDSNLLLLPGAVVEPLTGTLLQSIPDTAHRFLNSRSILQSKDPGRFAGYGNRNEGNLSVFKLDPTKLARTAAAVQDAGDLASTGLAPLTEPDFASLSETPTKPAPGAKPMRLQALTTAKYLGGVAIETPSVVQLPATPHQPGQSLMTQYQDALQHGAGNGSAISIRTPPVLFGRADAAAAVFSELTFREAEAGTLPVSCTRLRRLSLIDGRPTAVVELPTVSRVLAVSPDADFAVVAPVAHAWDGRLDIWPITHGASKPLVAFRPTRSKELPRWVAMPTSNTVVVLSGDGQLTAWRVPELKPVWSMNFRSAGAPTLSPDWRYLVLATPPTLSAIDVEAGQVVTAWEAPEAGDAYVIAVHPDGSRVAILSPTRQRVTIRSTADGKQLGAVDLPANLEWPLRWVMDGYLLLGDSLVLHPDKAAPIWQVGWPGTRATGLAIPAPGSPERVALLDTLPDGRVWTMGLRSFRRTHHLPTLPTSDGLNRQYFMVAVNVPDPAAAAQIAKANAAVLVLARAGDKLSLDFQMSGHACATGVAVTEITKILTNHGYQVAPGQRLKLVIRGAGRVVPNMYKDVHGYVFVHRGPNDPTDGRQIDLSFTVRDGDNTLATVHTTVSSPIEAGYHTGPQREELVNRAATNAFIERINRLTCPPLKPPAPLDQLGISAPEFIAPKQARDRWYAPKAATLRYTLHATETQERAELKLLDDLDKPLSEAMVRFSGYTTVSAIEVNEPTRNEALRKEIIAFNAVVTKIPNEAPGVPETTAASIKRFRESIVTLARLARQGGDLSAAGGSRLRRMASGESTAPTLRSSPILDEMIAGLIPELDYLRERHATLREKYAR